MSIACRHCNGTGVGELRGWEAETLRELYNAIWKPTRSIVLALSYSTHRLKPTAVINRLNALVRMGLVERRSEGARGAVEWRRTAAGRVALARNRKAYVLKASSALKNPCLSDLHSKE